MKRFVYGMVALIGLCGGQAEAAMITVAKDISVVDSTYADTNLNLYGFLSLGYTGDYTARAYLQFNLPTLTPGTVITSAVLKGYYRDDGGENDGLFSWYVAASGNWQETTMTWNNQPGSTGSPIATWDAATATVGTFQSFDITAAANQAYQGDGVLSLVLRLSNESETRTFEYFSDKESRPLQAFTLEYELSSSVSAVPAPAGLTLMGIGGAFSLLCYHLRRRTAEAMPVASA